MSDLLAAFTWYDEGADPRSAEGARYTFRPNGHGRFEPTPRRDLPPADRAERSRPQEFRYEVKGETLRIRFARAREWFETPFRIEPGRNHGARGMRFAQHRLVFARDPYAFVLAGDPRTDTGWESDAGAPLPSG